MSPKKRTTHAEQSSVAVGRRRIAEKYLEVAQLVADEEGATINVSVGLAVLAGIAASDAICISARGERYSGQDHAGAADVLSLVDRQLAGKLRALVALKPASHYGENLLSVTKRTKALRDAEALVVEAAART